tara:strand:+ start:3541 stop:4209 length:669 start_codon:yes stop_codon:yes gene_type:complete
MSSSDQKERKSSNTYSEKEQWEDDLDLPPIAHQKAKIKKPILEKAEFDQKKKTYLKPFLAIGSLILMIGIFFLITPGDKIQNPEISADPEIEKSTKDNQPINETQNIAQKEDKNEGKLNETWKEDTVIMVELLKTKAPQEERSEHERPKNYHIIIGSFKTKNNAKNWFEKKSSKEYGEHYIREFRDWYRVIYLSYSSVEQAEIEIDSIRNNLNLKAWIAYMK